MLFHYNGHGVPRPTANGEVWVFNKSYTQYIPLSVFDLQARYSLLQVLFSMRQNQDDVGAFKSILFLRQHLANFTVAGAMQLMTQKTALHNQVSSPECQRTICGRPGWAHLQYTCLTARLRGSS